MKETKQQEKDTVIETIMDQKLPFGTISPKQLSSAEVYRNILSSPLMEKIILPLNIHLTTCLIYKENSHEGLKYHFIEQITSNRLFTAERKPNNIGCNYIISKQERPKKQDSVGKLRGNFTNSQFFIYDGGENPNKNSQNKKNRKQLGFITFKQNFFFPNQTEVEILVPQIEQIPQYRPKYAQYQPKQFVPSSQKENLLVKQLEIRGKNVSVLKNKKSTKTNKQIKKSVQKRIILQLESQSKKTVFLFKERSQKTFLLKLSEPLNFIQGFCIALATIEKIKV